MHSNQMGIVYLGLFISLVVIFLINLSWVILNLAYWVTYGLQSLLEGMNFVENVYYSTYLRWILLIDTIWLSIVITFAFLRRNYKTNPELYYLQNKPISKPKIAVILPTYNEELAIKNVIKDFKSQKNVEYVFVIDNHSSDETVKIAKQCNVTVIEKDKDMGYPHSCVLGFKEALKTDADIIVLTESEGTFSGKDISKMVHYLEHSDMVVGTRQVQVLSEKGNQNSTLYVWGNYILAKLLQLRYFSIHHLSSIQLTDVGCSFRCFKRESLERIIDQFTYPKTDQVVVSFRSGLFALFTTMLFIENNFRVVEIPITFKVRIGTSKTGSDKKINGLRYFLSFMWYILRR